MYRAAVGTFWDMTMPVCGCAVSRAVPVIALALTGFLAFAPAAHPAETVTIGDLVFVNKALVGVGRLPSDLRDKFGETFAHTRRLPGHVLHVARPRPQHRGHEGLSCEDQQALH
jgi:hypothetical protein